MKIIYSLFRIFRRTQQLFYTFSAKIRIRMFGGKIGKGLIVSGRINLHLRPGVQVEIGDNVRINSGFSRNPVGGSLRTGIWVDCKGNLLIGENTGISNATIVSIESVRIGRNVFIGGGVCIYDNDFHALTAKGRSDSEPPKSAPIEIGDNVFIGGHSIILKGVKVGGGAVIGAGSVVTKDIPANQIWAGNPAKYIKELDNTGDVLESNL